MPRKTVRIVDLIMKTNTMLKNSTTTPDARMSVCLFLEDILHENGIYAGYQYFSADEVPEGHAPGIIIDERGTHVFNEALCDETRRRYHISHRIL